MESIFRPQVEDDPVLRHLPYFGDEDNDTFDYLSYYDSSNLVVEDKDGLEALSCVETSIPHNSSFGFLLDEYRTESVLKILRKKGIPEKQILEMYSNDRKGEWTEADKKVNDVIIALAKIFRVDPDTMAERVVGILEKKPQPPAELPLRSIDNIDK